MAVSTNLGFLITSDHQRSRRVCLATGVLHRPWEFANNPADRCTLPHSQSLIPFVGCPETSTVPFWMPSCSLKQPGLGVYSTMKQAPDSIVSECLRIGWTGGAHHSDDLATYPCDQVRFIQDFVSSALKRKAHPFCEMCPSRGGCFRIAHL